jgi:hypothetical protein
VEEAVVVAVEEPMDSVEQALSIGLFLALTAPSDVQAAEAVALTERLASGQSAELVERCKRLAVEQEWRLQGAEVARVGALRPLGALWPGQP